MLVRVDEITYPGATGKFQRLFDFIDAADVCVDKHRAAVVCLGDSKISGAFGGDDGIDGVAQPLDFRFHTAREISDSTVSFKLRFERSRQLAVAEIQHMKLGAISAWSSIAEIQDDQINLDSRVRGNHRDVKANFLINIRSRTLA